MDKAKLGLVLQCYPGDMYSAEDLAELICKIEPAPRTDVEFILLRRRDVNAHFSIGLAKDVRKKFPRFTDVKSRRYGTGWPEGCNDVWQDGMRLIGGLHGKGHITADGVLTFEHDCVPIAENWLDVLIAEWQATLAEGKEVCGSLCHEGNPESHINGNAIFCTDIIRRHDALKSSSMAWDYEHRKLLCAIARPSEMIRQQYNRTKPIEDSEVELFREAGAVMIHGVKNTSVLEYAQRTLLKPVDPLQPIKPR